jgi:CubicO group peptidase (beta-lactamase class C family)
MRRRRWRPVAPRRVIPGPPEALAWRQTSPPAPLPQGEGSRLRFPLSSWERGPGGEVAPGARAKRTCTHGPALHAINPCSIRAADALRSESNLLMNLIVSWRLRATTSAIILAAWVALFPLMASAAPAAAPHATPDFGAIDAYVLAQMSMEHIPGVALGIVHGNQIVHLRGFGVADQAGAAVTPQTDFSISSMTKSFTAVAIMQLVEQGQVALDAPVQRYLPWFRVATPGASATITVRELLNQTSGISHYAGNLVIAGDKAETMKQAAQALATLPLDTPPGAAFQYSNVNYVTLGLIVEAASGQPYATYVQQHIFAPLQMTSSATIVNPPPQRDMATGYHWWYGLPVASSYRNPPDDLPAGGIISNAQDMAHYLIAHLNGGSYGSVSILTPDSIALLHHAIVFPSVTTDPYAMGWYDVHVDRTPVLWHSGDDPNFQADMALIPQGQWGGCRAARRELGTLQFHVAPAVLHPRRGHRDALRTSATRHRHTNPPGLPDSRRGDASADSTGRMVVGQTGAAVEAFAQAHAHEPAVVGHRAIALGGCAATDAGLRAAYGRQGSLVSCADLLARPGLLVAGYLGAPPHHWLCQADTLRVADAAGGGAVATVGARCERRRVNRTDECAVYPAVQGGGWRRSGWTFVRAGGRYARRCHMA